MRPSRTANDVFPQFRGRARRLSDGGQARVSLVLPANDVAAIIVKQFKARPGVDRALEEERDALERLRRLVHDRCMRGWTIFVPQVVAVSRRPPALALTRVPGEPIDDLIRRGWAPAADMSDAIADVFGEYWEGSGRPLGDVNLRNLLCAPGLRQLAFVDPGAPDAIFDLGAVTRRFYPASRDLGYLLHEVLSTNVRHAMVSGARAAARTAFARAIITACVSRRPDSEGFVDEIVRCTAAHLERLHAGRSVRGAWRRVVRQRALKALPREAALLRSSGSWQ